MRQAKFSLTNGQMEFLARYKEYGYKDKSELVRTALERLQVEAERRRMDRSAALYANLYAEDDDLQRMTDTALNDWPE